MLILCALKNGRNGHDMNFHDNIFRFFIFLAEAVAAGTATEHYNEETGNQYDVPILLVERFVAN